MPRFRLWNWKVWTVILCKGHKTMPSSYLWVKEVSGWLSGMRFVNLFFVGPKCWWLVQVQRNAIQKMVSVCLRFGLGFFTTFHSSPVISVAPPSGSICVVNSKNLGLLVCLLLKARYYSFSSWLLVLLGIVMLFALLFPVGLVASPDGRVESEQLKHCRVRAVG